jgi:threonine/homoserine/homoserine lactone efflux protein
VALARNVRDEFLIQALLVGLLAGFVASIPVAGPTAALVLARTLERRTREAIFIALGGAVPEGLYAFMACWGTTAVVARFPKVVGVSHAVGGVALAAVGVWLVVRAQEVGAPPEADGRESRGVVTGFAMTMANPTLALSWTAAVGFLHSIALLPLEARAALPFALGVTAGVSAWFGLAIRMVERLRGRLRKGKFVAIVRVIGAGFVAVGAGVATGAIARGLG